MFENVLNGLPIARALVITDPDDESLFLDNAAYLDNQYVVRNDLLVAPFITQQTDKWGDVVNKTKGADGNPLPLYRDYGHREVYLPQPDSWYPFNLDAEFKPIIGFFGRELLTPITGGSVIDYEGAIDTRSTSYDSERLRYLTPMFVREGAIIPQIDVKLYVPDKEIDPGRNEMNHYTIHVYPGKSSDPVSGIST